MNTEKKSFKLSDFAASFSDKYLRFHKLPDPRQTRVSEILHTLTLIILLMSLAIISITPFIFSSILNGLIITGTFIGFSLIVYFLNQERESYALSAYFYLFDSGSSIP